MVRSASRAFTLIELLVVITIIVVLLALLTPALDRAIYAAELAVCGSQVRGIAQGTTAYAMEFKRRYPHRVDSYSAETPDMLYNTFDDDEVATPSPRAMLAPYMGINAMFNDPFTEKVEYASNKFSHSWAPYSMWFSYAFVGVGGGSAMRKVGDRWSFTGDGRTRRYNLLITDMNQIEQGFGAAYSAHPDEAGLLSSKAWEEVTWAGVDDPGTAPFASGVPNAAHNWSRWVSFNSPQHGAVDYNVAYADGSVARFEKVHWDAWDPTSVNRHEGIARVPLKAETDSFPDEYTQVPVR